MWLKKKTFWTERKRGKTEGRRYIRKPYKNEPYTFFVHYEYVKFRHLLSNVQTTIV